MAAEIVKMVIKIKKKLIVYFIIVYANKVARLLGVLLNSARIPYRLPNLLA